MPATHAPPPSSDRDAPARRPRFTLRALLATCTLVVCVGAAARGWWAAQQRQWRVEQRLAAELRAAGFSLRWDYGGPSALDRWLADSPPLQRVAEAWCDAPHARLEAALPQLGALSRLRTLLVFGGQLEGEGEGEIADDVVDRLARFPALELLLIDISPRSLIDYDEPTPAAPPPALEQALRARLPDVSVQWLRVH
jgi:hypothetical protein